MTFKRVYRKYLRILDKNLKKKSEKTFEKYPDLSSLPNELPPYRPSFDHEMPLIDNAQVPPAKVYIMSIAKLEELRKQLDIYLSKIGFDFLLPILLLRFASKEKLMEH